MIPDKNEAWGFTLFADDLREEIGGKTSFMGVYQNDFVVTAPSLPVVLPKLFAIIMYYEIANRLTSDLRFTLELPAMLPEQQAPEHIVRRSDAAKVDFPMAEDGSPPLLHLRVPFVMSPFVMMIEGPIKARCYYSDGSVLRLGRLNLIHRKPIENA